MNTLATRMATLMLGGALLFSACGDDDETQKTRTITDLVVDGAEFSTLESALVAAGLDETLEGAGPFTVFAPTNAAFSKLPAGTLDALLADKEALTAVLKYHVVAGRVPAATVVTLTEAATLNGAKVSIKIVDGSVFLNDTIKVTTTDIAADNGIIHVIDGVLVPPEEPEPNTIADIVAGTPDFSTLKTALEAADLVDTLAGEGPFTVFAPTNAAFAKIPAADLQALLADKEALTAVLKYHVVAGRVPAATVVTLSEATTLNGAKVNIKVVDGEVILNDTIKVTTTDVEADNGIVHIIDGVLLPPKAPNTITDIVSTNPDFSTLKAAVVAADLATTLAGAGPYTVFAPTNAAIAKIPGADLQALLADKPRLTSLLKYHVVAGRVPAETVVTLTKATTLNGADVRIKVVDGGVVLNDTVKVTQTDIQADNGIIHVIDAVLIPPTIVDIVNSNPDFSTLKAALGAGGLGEVLAGPGPFTVFAPNNAAIAKIPSADLQALLANTPKLVDLLKYHVLAGRVPAATVVTLTEATTLNGQKVTIKVVNNEVFLNDTIKVIATDIIAENGIIHVIDTVLTPPPTIADVVRTNANFSTLKTALVAAELDTVLDGEGPFTVFAPTNAAFGLIPQADLTALLANKAELTDVLLYHVVAGTKLAADVVAADYLVTENGGIAPITTAGGAKIGGVTISQTDIKVRNGVIHVIDAVLLPPPTIAEIVTSNDDFDTLQAAVGAAGLGSALDGEDLLTVFAPNDAAFAKIPSATLNALIADVPALTDVLLYHVFDGVVPARVAITLTTATAKNGDAVTINYTAGTQTLKVNTSTVIATNVWARNGIIHVIDTVLTPPAP